MFCKNCAAVLHKVKGSLTLGSVGGGGGLESRFLHVNADGAETLRHKREMLATNDDGHSHLCVYQLKSKDNVIISVAAMQRCTWPSRFVTAVGTGRFKIAAGLTRCQSEAPSKLSPAALAGCVCVCVSIYRSYGRPCVA